MEQQREYVFAKIDRGLQTEFYLFKWNESWVSSIYGFCFVDFCRIRSLSRNANSNTLIAMQNDYFCDFFFFLLMRLRIAYFYFVKSLLNEHGEPKCPPAILCTCIYRISQSKVELQINFMFVSFCAFWVFFISFVSMIYITFVSYFLCASFMNFKNWDFNIYFLISNIVYVVWYIHGFGSTLFRIWLRQ